jgi:predicted dehydrogenase
MPSSLDISIIGAGQIGSRHLQSFAQLQGSARIQLVDTSQVSLDVACQRFDSVYKGDSRKITLQVFNRIKDLDEHQDMTIVATDAIVRSDVIKELIQLKSIKAMICEKVLFQTEEEYFEINSLLEAEKIPVWVNCILRAMPFFKNLKALLDRDKIIRMRVEGADWGLACNGIHFLDLFSFLTGCDDFEFTNTRFDQVIPDFKRPESKEFIGEMAGVNSKGHELVMSCKESGSYSKKLRGLKTIHIDNGTTRHQITVFPDKVTHKTVTGKSVIEVTKSLPMQSQITHQLVEDVVRLGSCGLPTFSNSMTLHLSLIREFLKHLVKITGKNVTRCPIT